MTMISSRSVIFNGARNQSRITPRARLRNQVKCPTAGVRGARYLHNRKQPSHVYRHARALAAKVTNGRRQSSHTFETRSPPASLYGTVHTYVFTLRTRHVRRN